MHEIIDKLEDENKELGDEIDVLGEGNALYIDFKVILSKPYDTKEVYDFHTGVMDALINTERKLGQLKGAIDTRLQSIKDFDRRIKQSNGGIYNWYLLYYLGNKIDVLQQGNANEFRQASEDEVKQELEQLKERKEDEQHRVEDVVKRTQDFIIYSKIRQDYANMLKCVDGLIRNKYSSIFSEISNISKMYENPMNLTTEIRDYNKIVNLKGGDIEETVYNNREISNKLNELLQNYSQKTDVIRTIMFKIYDIYGRIIKVHHILSIYNVYKCSVMIDKTGYGNNIPLKECIQIGEIQIIYNHLDKLNKKIKDNKNIYNELINVKKYHKYTLKRLLKFSEDLLTSLQTSSGESMEDTEQSIDIEGITDRDLKEELYTLCHFYSITRNLV